MAQSQLHARAGSPGAGDSLRLGFGCLRHGDCTASLGSLSQCPATLSIKKLSLLRWNSLCSSLCTELGKFHLHAEVYMSLFFLSRGCEQVRSKHECVCVHESFRSTSNSVLPRMFSQCISTVVFLVWRAKIQVYRNQKFIRVQICSKQNQTTKAEHPQTQATPTPKTKEKHQSHLMASTRPKNF